MGDERYEGVVDMFFVHEAISHVIMYADNIWQFSNIVYERGFREKERDDVVRGVPQVYHVVCYLMLYITACLACAIFSLMNTEQLKRSTISKASKKRGAQQSPP